jgi:hypothetical protein
VELGVETLSKAALAELTPTVTVAVLAVGAVITQDLVTAAAAVRRAIQVLAVMVDTLLLWLLLRVLVGAVVGAL